MSYETLDAEGKAFGFPQEEDFDIIVDERETSPATVLDKAIEQVRLNSEKSVAFKTSTLPLLVPIPLTMPTREIYDLKRTLESARGWYIQSPANSSYSGTQFLRDSMTDISGTRSDEVISAAIRFAELLEWDRSREITLAMAKMFLTRGYETYAKYAPPMPNRPQAGSRRGWQGPQPGKFALAG